jgi:hypothetical protein
MNKEKIFLSTKDLENYGIRSCQTSRNLIWAGKDPIRHYKIGGRIKFAVKDVKAYLAKSKVEGIL